MAELSIKFLKEVSSHQLKVNHPFYRLFEVDCDDTYIESFRRFSKAHNIPMCIKFGGEYMVIRNKEEVTAAKENNIDIPTIAVIEGLNDYEILDFIAHGTHFYKKGGKTGLYNRIKYLSDYFETPLGKKWRSELKGDKKKNLAQILRTSETTVQYVEFIGDHDEYLLEACDNGNITFTEAYRKAQLAKSKEKKDNVIREVALTKEQLIGEDNLELNTVNVANEELAKVKKASIDKIQLRIEGAIGKVVITIEKGLCKVTRNNKKIQDCDLKVKNQELENISYLIHLENHNATCEINLKNLKAFSSI